MFTKTTISAALLVALTGCGGSAGGKAPVGGARSPTVQPSATQASTAPPPATQPPSRPSSDVETTRKANADAAHAADAAQPSPRAATTDAAGASIQPASAKGPAFPGDPPPAEVQEIVTSSGARLRYFDLKVGSGEPPRKLQKVAMNYSGWLGDKTPLDSTTEKGKPYEYTVGVNFHIKGWDLGISTMKAGGKRLLYIPPELGYGRRGASALDIPPNAALVYEVELLEIK
jgi:peptidylprolyl isomerase